MTPARTAPPAARKLAERPAAPPVAVLVEDEEWLLVEDDLVTLVELTTGETERPVGTEVFPEDVGREPAKSETVSIYIIQEREMRRTVRRGRNS